MPYNKLKILYLKEMIVCKKEICKYTFEQQATSNEQQNNE